MWAVNAARTPVRLGYVPLSPRPGPLYRAPLLRVLPPRVIVPFGGLVVFLAAALVAVCSW